jgi:uncharacterized protein YidB (DUF937 family)
MNPPFRTTTLHRRVSDWISQEYGVTVSADTVAVVLGGARVFRNSPQRQAERAVRHLRLVQSQKSKAEKLRAQLAALEPQLVDSLTPQEAEAPEQPLAQVIQLSAPPVEDSDEFIAAEAAESDDWDSWS